jgi:hypothetical protein
MFRMLLYDVLYVARTEMMLEELWRRTADAGMPPATLDMFVDTVTDAYFMRGPPLPPDLLAIWQMSLVLDGMTLELEQVRAAITSGGMGDLADESHSDAFSE